MLLGEILAGGLERMIDTALLEEGVKSQPQFVSAWFWSGR